MKLKTALNFKKGAKMKFHEYANIFPFMQPAEFEELKDETRRIKALLRGGFTVDQAVQMVDYENKRDGKREPKRKVKKIFRFNVRNAVNL